MSDERLMERLLEGDESSLDELVRRYQGPLFGLAYRMLCDAPAAEDAFQETFLRVYRRRFSYRPGSAVKPWLYQICLNVCRDHLRRIKRRPECSLEQADRQLEADELTPQERAEQAEDSQRLRDALALLPPKHRDVLILSHYQNLSYPEISNLLDVPSGTVKSRVFHALKKLATLLKRD